MVARIPLFLFQAVQASLLPKLSALAHSGQLVDFRRGLKRLLVVVAALAAVGTLAGFLLGPFVVEIMFPDADLSAPAPWASWPPARASTCWPSPARRR